MYVLELLILQIYQIQLLVQAVTVMLPTGLATQATHNVRSSDPRDTPGKQRRKRWDLSPTTSGFTVLSRNQVHHNT